ncbi:helix-turn-helix domain-containing protein [uncultured Bacteroides sp.]|uniref:helix-turn-helix domain-containing protein n=2 Tax=uncultured Bacteroides sp. TaxID=162156 RepID=UPI002670A187|nr:helix-turn-helix domain-containing protein [uncultured Bacteroides sp.]
MNMKKLCLLAVFSFLIVMVFKTVSIHYLSQKDSSLEVALRVAGDNRAELEKLELFLREENSVLSVNAIGEALWNEESNYENKVYQVINRLRNSLKQTSTLSVDRASCGGYRLNIREVKMNIES